MFLADDELAKLVAVILADTGNESDIPDIIKIPPESSWDYYSISLSWFSESIGNNLNFMELYNKSISTVSDFETYFKCLCELHKRRRKYEMIMSSQPLATMLQVSPRSLLEFGLIASPALPSWLIWRKWFYDIDNRAAQETGYLFEPILANSLGGSPYDARNSPIKRKSDPRKGRQVDCIVDKDAYEFKLRVTIAASGQGRFSQEIEFATDCRESGFNPILLVLDPTESYRLTDLSNEFRRVGGEAYIGQEAWKHLEERSGRTMATFLEKYVRRPIESMDTYSDKLLDISVSVTPDKRTFSIKLGDDYKRVVERSENLLLEGTDNMDNDH